jgi:hypothetical protein
MSRNYSYDTKYENSPQQIKNREARNRARAEETRKLGKAAVKGKDIDHTKSLKGGGSRTAASNLRVRSVHANRGDKTF